LKTWARSWFERKVFVEPWETRIFGIHVAMMALSSQLPLPATPSGLHTVWTWADLRKGAESLSPFDFFKYRCYEKWLGGISGYMVENGYVTEAELETRTQQILVNPAAVRKTGGDSAIDKRINTCLIEGDSPRRELEKPQPSRRATKSMLRTRRQSSTPGCRDICASALA
jgi:nitrile hydratase subunit beta